MKTNDAGMHVVLIGNPVDGVNVVGPFKTGQDALNYISTDPYGEYMWPVRLDAPAANWRKAVRR